MGLSRTSSGLTDEEYGVYARKLVELKAMDMMIKPSRDFFSEKALMLGLDHEVHQAEEGYGFTVTPESVLKFHSMCIEYQQRTNIICRSVEDYEMMFHSF